VVGEVLAGKVSSGRRGALKLTQGWREIEEEEKKVSDHSPQFDGDKLITLPHSLRLLHLVFSSSLSPILGTSLYLLAS